MALDDTIRTLKSAVIRRVVAIATMALCGGKSPENPRSPESHRKVTGKSKITGKPKIIVNYQFMVRHGQTMLHAEMD